MTPSQRAAAERLVEGPRTSSVLWSRAVIALLRELLAEPVQEPVLTLLEQSRQTCLRNFGPNGMADWVYNDLSELLANAAPQHRKPLNRIHACDDPLCAVCGHGITPSTSTDAPADPASPPSAS